MTDFPQDDRDPFTADLLRRASRISIRWARAMELLEEAEHEEQRQAEEAAEAHMDSPWPHRPDS